jgi:NAD(P)-dependent dehydrogenase (short-subunit alcohol dehydrogenase family)
MKKRVVLITGPTGNLGGAVVHRFLPEQPHLILIDRHPDRLLDVYQDLKNSPDHLLIPGVDLVNNENVRLAVEQSLNTFGKVDCLVHTAGGFRMGETVPQITDESLDFMIDLNLKTTLNITRAVIPHMIANQAGKIVTIGARPGLEGRKKMGAYSASKAAVLRITETMAAELKGTGINVNSLIPGTIDTPQNREAMPSADTSRWVSPESLADVIYFLCSSGARDIQGAAIPVFGG